MLTVYHFFSIALFFCYYLLIIAVALRILMKPRAVASTTSWLLIIFIVPIFGMLAYFLIGELNLGKYRAKRAEAMWPITKRWIAELKQCPDLFSNKTSAISQSLFKLCEKRQGIPAIKNNHLSLLTDSEEILRSICQDIDAAQHEIVMVFYIWHTGGLADNVAQALINAAKRGVHCQVMLDSVGSRQFFKSDSYQRLLQAGVHIVEALKVRLLRALLRRMDLRQHRKLIVIDNTIAYTGSMNLVDPRFFKQNIGVGQWVDLMVRIEGAVGNMLAALFACDWEMETGEHRFPPLPKTCHLANITESGHTVHVIPSGPSLPEDMINQALITAIYSAQQRLIMTTPYLVPNEDLLHAICTAGQRGVDVSIIVPAKNDSLMVRWASRAFYTDLLKANVKIYQFSGGLLHTKSVLIDDELSLIGTANLDIRSLSLNFELTIAIDDHTFALSLLQIQHYYIAQSTLLTLSTWQKRPIWHHVIERLFYFCSPLL